jgi:hypothetical protein
VNEINVPLFLLVHYLMGIGMLFCQLKKRAHFDENILHRQEQNIVILLCFICSLNVFLNNFRLLIFSISESGIPVNFTLACNNYALKTKLQIGQLNLQSGGQFIWHVSSQSPVVGLPHEVHY